MLPCFSSSSTPLCHLFLLLLAWESEVRGHQCPPGQIFHNDEGRSKCCLPVDCSPDHVVKYCKMNGTADFCWKCPVNYGLYKRTSSFAIQPCHVLKIFPSISVNDKCKAHDEHDSESVEDSANCFCKLEEGSYYLKPQIALSFESNCQPFREMCQPGSQPTHSGVCLPCPPNTVQDEESFKLCRPQRNCSALKLETKISGDSTREAECAKAPPLPPGVTVSTVTKPTTTKVPPKPPSTTSVPSDASVRTSINNAENEASLIVVIAVICSVALVGVILFLFFGYRKGWLKRMCRDGRCHHGSMEGQSGSDGALPMSGRDTDTSSDNSCYTCADSCLSSSSKNNAATNGAACYKGQRPLPMLEAYMNMNGKSPPESLPNEKSLMSEPVYNSISHDEKEMPLYKNTNGFVNAPVMHGYPNRVHLISSHDSDSFDTPVYAQVQQRSANRNTGKEREDFTETDPLLPSNESQSSGVPTPSGTPVLKGILRNGNNHRPKPQVGRQQQGVSGEGSVGNRPHLSMLLNSTDDTSHLVGEEAQANNLPHFSQLVSGQASMQRANGGPNPTPPVQRQQLQQATPQQETERAQHDSPLAARLIPVTTTVAQQRLNPSLVQMEELKPVLPLSPGSPGPTTPAEEGVMMGVGGAGVGPHQRSGSPARISPTQQEVGSRHNSPRVNVRRAENRDRGRETKEEKETARKEGGGKLVEREINEETLMKQAAGGAGSPSDDTLQKSVCASSGLGDSLEFSSPLELPPSMSMEGEGGERSRTMYRRSNSEASRSVSPVHQLPPSRSISTPEEKHRPFAVVKPMQSDQSLNAMSDSHDRLTELTHQLDAAGRQFPLTSLAGPRPGRQSSQANSDSSEETRPKTPDNLSEEEEEEEERGGEGLGESEGRTGTRFYGENDGGGHGDRDRGVGGGKDTAEK